jgi:hypothetical protein
VINVLDSGLTTFADNNKVYCEAVFSPSRYYIDSVGASLLTMIYT